MLYFIAASILIRVAALTWSVLMWVRLRDWRMGWLTALMTYLLGRQALTLASLVPEQNPPRTELIAEVLAMGTSIVCLGMLWSLGRMIHDREAVALTLRRSEETQRALLDAIPDAMFRMSRDGTYLGYKAQDESRLIVPPSVFMGKKVSEVLPENLARMCMDAIAAALSSGAVQTYEYDFARDNEERNWEVRVSPCGADQVLVLVRNVSDRNRIARALQQTTQDLERAQAIAHTGSWISDAESSGRLTWSHETCRIFGYEPGTFDERVETFFRHVHPDDVEAVRRAAAATFRDDTPYDVEHRIVRADGQVRWVHQQAGIVRDAGGRPLRMIGVIQDITEHKLAEESLAESEQRYRNLFDLSPQPMWVFERSSLKFLAVNQAAVREYGFSEQEFLSMTLRDIRPPEEVPALERRLADTQSRPILRGVFRHHRKDGSQLEAQITATPVVFRGIRAEMVVVMDLTEQRRAQQALRESEERYRRLAEHGAVGIWEVDTEGRTIYANPNMCALLEVDSAADLRGVNFRRFFTPESLAVMDRELQRRRRGEASSYQVDLVGARGGRKTAIVSGAPMLDTGARLTSLIGTFTDITGLRIAQERLRAVEQRNAALIRQTPLGVIVWDTQRRVLEWNLTAEQIFGYTFEQAVGKTFNELIVPEPMRAAVDRVWADLLTETGGIRSTNENITSAGRRIICEWYNTPLADADGRIIGVASLVQDVTDVKRLEAELRQSQKMEAVGRLASGVAHDFSNLLTAISGFTSLARRTLSPMHPAVRSLDRVDDAARQAVGVTKALLTFSRGGGGVKAVVAIGSAVQDAVRILRRTLPANINLRLRISDAPVPVHADATQLQQVVMNLAINARDAMPRGGTLSILVQDRPGPDARDAVISVSDTGIGMSPEVRSHIFEPFFTTKPVGEGTGLGLAITHAIVKDHGGRIEVQSEPGKGTTFTILLPITTAPANPEPENEAPPMVGQGQQVLLTSGRPYLRELIASSLGSMGFRIVQFHDLESAAAASGTHAARVHVVDADTLGIPPQEAVARAESIPGEMATMFLVAEVKSLVSLVGPASRVVPKPFQISDLAATIGEALK